MYSFGFSPATIRFAKAVAKAPLIPQPIPYVVVPMATFRTNAPSYEPDNAGGQKKKERVTNKNEASGTGAPSTDEIAHSDAAYSGSGANPKESTEKIEKEKDVQGGFQGTAADPSVSKPPKGTSR